MDNTDRLRAKLIKIEGKIRSIMESDGRWNANDRCLYKMHTLLIERAGCLDRMFLATPEEVTRFEQLNDMLIQKDKDMRLRAAMLWETMLRMKQMPEFDDLYEVRGELRVEGDRSDEEAVLRLPEDEYYGSDFALANEALVGAMPDNWNHAWCSQAIHPWQIAENGKDPGWSFSTATDEIENWAVGALRYPALSHINVCHPIHDLYDHLSFSIQDIIRINSFSTKVWLEISNDVTQSGIRSFEEGFRH